MMKIFDFTEEWLPKAMDLAAENYDEERALVPALPEPLELPELSYFCQNGLGVVAVEGNKLLGFLAAVGPWSPAFHTPNVVGVYSPAHAHGAVGENRFEIYQRLYQAAAEKWVKAGASSHAITLYAHDKAAEEAFFRYGFGLRCMDFVRPMEELPCQIDGVTLLELPFSRHEELTPLRKALAEHLSHSPSFMKSSEEQMNTWLERRANEPPRVFAAQKDGIVIAYIEAEDEGEHFITAHPTMMNICGAYCLPEHRGTGVSQALLSFLSEMLKKEGYQTLGVDCESINPTAAHFWSKYFTAYTHSVVRRIDENVLL